MKFLTIFLLTFASLFADAAVKRQFNDLKLPNQAMLEKQSFGAPIAASATAIVSAHAGATSAAARTITSGFSQPDVARNLTITPAGTTGDVESCVVVVNGTNIKGKVISENFTFAADASTAQTGNKAFRTISSITWPASCESGSFAATWNIGVGEKIGIRDCLAAVGDWAWSHAAGAYESTRATVVVSASAVESNTADFNGTMNGSNQFVGYFIQNFGCK